MQMRIHEMASRSRTAIHASLNSRSKRAWVESIQRAWSSQDTPAHRHIFSEHWDETSRDCRGPPLHNELDQLECGTVVGWHWVHRTGHLNESIIDFQVRGTQAEVGGPVRTVIITAITVQWQRTLYASRKALGDVAMKIENALPTAMNQYCPSESGISSPPPRKRARGRIVDEAVVCPR